ncbi:MAG: orotidine 5'-phosphate decarboxylase [Methanosarcinales archaeon]|nr:orotidine 5'-phosphate decarboxylase [Methanosarcinales archaeon]
MDLFNLKYGIIPACDVKLLDDLEDLVKSTCNIKGIVGYKVGAILGLKYGLPAIVETISTYTNLPIIYDHQKFGTDIPDICGGDMLEVLKEAGINIVIIFPQAGPDTLKAAIVGSIDPKLKDTVKGCYKFGLSPIVGGEMTHNKYIESDGGYLTNEAPERMYLDAAKLGVEYFVVPGTKVEKMKKYRLMLSKASKNPKFLFPGIGRDYQGGDIIEAFNAVKPFSSYAIVGRAIYAADDIKESTERLCEVIRKF